MVDFANLVLLGTSSSNINKLQRVQNCLARVVLLDQSSPATSLLSQLHWLPVPKRIEFKIATLTYQSVTLGQPTYLSALLTPYQPHRSLRPVSQNLLPVPRCNSSFGQRSFSYSAPTIWNGLPLAVRQSPSLHSFKRNLKTLLLRQIVGRLATASSASDSTCTVDAVRHINGSVCMYVGKTR